MGQQRIHPLTMPKWGLSMTEGKVIEWLLEEGAPVERGSEVVEVETDKIASAVEASQSGRLRRQIAQPGEIIPVSGLLAIIAEAEVSDAEIDAFANKFQAEFVPPAADEAAAGPAYQFVEVGGRKLRYLAVGEGGEPVILVHGFGGDLDNWLFNHLPLSANRRVYALDLPGHGQSSKAVGTHDLAEMTNALEGFMDAVDIPRAHLVGHSLGGALTLCLAAARPERVHSLALIGSAGLGEEINGEYIEGFINSTGRRDLKPHLLQLFADPSLVTRQLVDDVLKYKRLDGATESLKELAANVFPEGKQAALLRTELANLALPVLVIWGAEDKIIPASHAQGLRQRVQVEVLPGSGHMVQMEAATEVNRLLEALFSGTPS